MPLATVGPGPPIEPPFAGDAVDGFECPSGIELPDHLTIDGRQRPDDSIPAAGKNDAGYRR